MRRRVSVLAIWAVAATASAALAAGDGASVSFSVSGGTKRDANTAVLIYGGAISLVGAVKGARSGVRVTIVTRRYGGAAISRELRTPPGASFSYTDVPAIASRYEVRLFVGAKLRFDGTFAVLVGPRLVLTAVSPARAIFAVSVQTPHSFAGRVVVIQRRVTEAEWRPILRVRLAAGSAARFHLHLPRGRTVLRAVLPAAEAGPGYTYGLSNTFFFSRL